MMASQLWSDPVEQLRSGYAEAELAGPQADVVVLATASADVVPSVRMVRVNLETAGVSSLDIAGMRTLRVNI